MRYGRGKEQKDPRQQQMPSRPPGHRTEPSPQHTQANYQEYLFNTFAGPAYHHAGDSFTFSAGFFPSLLGFQVFVRADKPTGNSLVLSKWHHRQTAIDTRTD